jgi:hypothetical protein
MPVSGSRQTVLDLINSTKQLRKVVIRTFNWLIFPTQITFTDIVRILPLFYSSFLGLRKISVACAHDGHFCLYLAFFAALAAWVIGILLLRKKFFLKNAQGLSNPNFIATEPKPQSSLNFVRLLAVFLLFNL